MKKLFLLSALATLTAVTGCQTPTNASDTEKPPIVGGDRDAHGCIGSAGYSWSETRNSCVRIWEVGTRLKATDSKENATDYIIIQNGDDKPIEVYGPNIKRLVLNGKKPVWSDANGIYSIEISNAITLFKADNGKKSAIATTIVE